MICVPNVAGDCVPDMPRVCGRVCPCPQDTVVLLQTRIDALFGKDLHGDNAELVMQLQNAKHRFQIVLDLIEIWKRYSLSPLVPLARGPL